jgi:hypothetical protein
VALSILLIAGGSLAPGAGAKKEGHVPPGQAKKAPAVSSPRVTAQGTTGTTGTTGQSVGPAAAPESAGSKGNGRGKGPKKVVSAPPAPTASPAPAPASTAPAPVTTATPTAPAASAPPTATPRQQRTTDGGGVRPRAERRTAARSGRAAVRAVSAAGGSGAAAVPTVPSPADRGRSARPAPESGAGEPAEETASVVTRTVRDIVEIVPGWMKLALAGLAAMSLLLAGGYLFTALRARSLARQRGELLNEVGLLQGALLPPVPEKLGALYSSVAYRPADGPAAGGDFYDALPLDGGRVGFVIGDVSGHGRDALERTAFMRYTLRAYLEAGLEPRVALQVAERAIGERLGGDFATVLLAVHDPSTACLRYATAGHPPPIVVGANEPFEPVIAGSSPPIGIAERTGLRQTTVPLMPGTVACLFTDGLVEARTADGLLGRERLEEIVAELGPRASAEELLARVRDEATDAPDDMATCLLSPSAGVTTGGFRSELLEISDTEVDGPLARRFLEECGVPAAELDAAESEIRETAETYGGAIVSVAFGARRAVRVLPRNVASIESASWRAASAVG